MVIAWVKRFKEKSDGQTKKETHFFLSSLMEVKTEKLEEEILLVVPFLLFIKFSHIITIQYSELQTRDENFG